MAYLREQMRMPPPFAAWWDSLHIAVKKVICKAAKVATYTETPAEGGSLRYSRSLDWSCFSDKEQSRIEIKAKGLKGHFDSMPQREEKAAC